MKITTEEQLNEWLKDNIALPSRRELYNRFKSTLDKQGYVTLPKI